MIAQPDQPVACVADRSRCVLCGLAASRRADDPLPSWNDGPAKQAILEFVEA